MKTLPVTKLNARDLVFISQIARDGSSVEPVFPELQNFEHGCNEEYVITLLSNKYKTYIASGFNSYVVTLTDECRNRLNLR